MLESAATQDNVIQALSRIPADWFRDGFKDSSSGSVQSTVATYKRMQDQGKRLLVSVLQHPEDYGWDMSRARYAGPAFLAKCGWRDGQFPLSTIDLATFDKRVAANLQGFKTAGISVDAFEIGNEVDWVCFNGDVPLDRTATPTEVATIARGYATFLEHAVRTIGQYYPNATIVSYGAVATTQAGVPGTVENAGRILAALKNLDGKDYMSLIDKIGVHAYVSPDDPGAAVRMIAQYTSDAQTTKPVWITEWGYPTGLFPTAQGRDRYTGFVDFYNAVTQPTTTPIENIFFYALDSFADGLTLVDHAYTLLPETTKFFGKF